MKQPYRNTSKNKIIRSSRKRYSWLFFSEPTPLFWGGVVHCLQNPKHFIYGLGYAFQQTLDSKFKTINVVGNNSSFESGFSGILEKNVNSKISESLDFVLNAKAVALSRENFFTDFDSSRRSILVRSGLFYKKVGMEYNFHQVHDLNLSADDLVDQSIMLTLTF